MKTTTFKRVLLLLIASCCLAQAPSAWATTPAKWKESGFSINANGMPLGRVLREFGTIYGVKLQVNTNVSDPVKGRVQGSNGAEFLDRLASNYKFNWFVYNKTLYIVSDDDNRSVRIQVGEDAVQDAKTALTGVGLFDDRFGWGELPDEGVVLLSGPREYVRLASEILLPDGKKASTAGGAAPTGKGRQMMLFRLKFASATDRVINVRGQKETVPGIKTMLSNLLQSGSGSGNGNGDRLSGDTPKFDLGSTKRSRNPVNGPGTTRDVGAAARADNRVEEEEEIVSAGSRSKNAGREEKPRIEADASLNAIIIYDNVNKHDLYQNLIAELDVEPGQVEIEALIVDIDRNSLSEMGVEWAVEIGNRSAAFNGTTGDSAGPSLPIPGSTLLIRNAPKFYARLKALEGTGDARVLAKPTVLTLENVAAVLDLSQSAYVPLVGERVADLANVTAGTMLRVVPRILRDGGNRTRVRLDVDIEDGTLGDANSKTNVTRSTITTQAIIDLQSTLMIGGYHSESKTQQHNKFPILGDLPGVGGLFRNTNDTTRNRERLFLITPRLAESGITAARRSAAGQKARLIIDTPAELVPAGEGARKPVAPAAPAHAPAEKEVTFGQLF
ncbi:MAG: type III secretion system outer membrane ring subunit SctC [Pseudomonadota bacterium]